MHILKSDSEQKFNLVPLYYLAIILLVSYAFISSTLYYQIKNTIIENKLEELNEHMLYQKALRHYINQQLKPIIYSFQEKNILNKEYFDPHIMSGTFITRDIYKIFNNNLETKEMTNWVYRLAASNPRNPINQATPSEIELIEQFNANPELKSLHKIENIDGDETLYYAAPFSPNTEDCLKCHGMPNDASKGILEMYGNVNGFHESLGQVRALTSYRLNLSDSMLSAQRLFYISTLILLSFFILLFILLAWVYISQQKRKILIAQQQETLEYVAHHDFLTKLKNRHALNQALPVQMAQLNAEDTSFTNLWALMLDIDFFKKVNDDFGHDVGDIVLEKLGEILLLETHKIEHAQAYRLGGEEFLIILRNSSQNVVKALYTDICNRLAQSQIKSLNRVLTLSAGSAEANPKEHQYDLLKRTDKALYQAKEQGRSKIVFN